MKNENKYNKKVKNQQRKLKSSKKVVKRNGMNKIK